MVSFDHMLCHARHGLGQTVCLYNLLVGGREAVGSLFDFQNLYSGMCAVVIREYPHHLK